MLKNLLIGIQDKNKTNKQKELLMAKKENEKSPVLTIEDKKYYQEDLNDEQLLMLTHVQDLDRKINSSKFNLQQLQFGKQAFLDAISASIKKAEETKKEK